MSAKQLSRWVCNTALCGLLGLVGLGLSACPSSDSGEGAPPPTASTGAVTITGTVSGTIIKVLNASTNAVLAQTDTASLPGQTPFAFSLGNLPFGVPIKVFFFSGGQAFALLVGSPATNVFTVTNPGALDFGFVSMNSGSAIPANQPPAGAISSGPADLTVPPGAQPAPATLTVSTPAPASGSVVVNFSVSNFTIGAQGQQHLHVRVDGGATRHFFNGSSNKVVDGSGNLTSDVQWQSAGSFRINGLSVGTHQVSVRLATAADAEFVNGQAIPPNVVVTITSPPAPLPTLTITSPSAGASLPLGPVTVAFAVSNFTIGGIGNPHLNISLDGGVAHFYNGTTNQVLDGNGQPVANISRISSTSFQITGLASGPHQIRLLLVDGADQNLPNAEANPAPLNITIQSPVVPSVAVTSGTTFLSSPVTITFSVTNFTIGLPGTPHMRFSIDGGALHDFYNGAGINSDNGVLLNGVHDHAVHWASSNSFILFGLTAAAHQISLILVDGSNNNVGASTVHNFTVQQPPTGDLQLQPMISGLSFPVGLAQAPDGRIFYNERLTGNVRVINPGWALDPTPFCSVSIQISGEQGLLGLALDPNFVSNNTLYVYYTRSGAGNRVSKLINSGSGCSETVILNLPTGTNHNGGIIKFGPDGKLYVVVGDNENAANAQNLDSLAGKILRVNADGSAPTDNPFFGTGTPERDKVYSYGHRNSFGLTFHPATGQLWESENGPDDNDEVNRIVGGKNYGWDSSQRDGFLNDPCCVDPIVVFHPPLIAPTGIIGIPGSSSIYPPAYRNNLLMAAWNDGTIRLVIPNASNPALPGTTSVAYTGGQGGLLSLMQGADGYVYVSNGLFTGTFPHFSSSIFRVIPH